MNLWDVARKDKGGKRDRFIARFFGIFSEEIAGLYFEHEKLSKYQNLGYPFIFLLARQRIIGVEC